MDNLPIQFASNFLSIILVGVLIYTFLKHKKRMDVITKLDELKDQNLLTQEDLSYISENEKEYKEKSEKADALAKLLMPVFILIVGVLFVYLPTSEAMIHLNAFVVAFILVQLNKINKKNTYTLLKDLKKPVKKEEN
ncbi:MAG: hypothetical protein KBD88_00920 [Aliarcobacter sp.]|nr:hypothetical protein [Aliarcobacter sp.]